MPLIIKNFLNESENCQNSTKAITMLNVHKILQFVEPNYRNQFLNLYDIFKLKLPWRIKYRFLGLFQALSQIFDLFNFTFTFLPLFYEMA